MILNQDSERENKFLPKKIEIAGMEFAIHPFSAIEALRLKTTLLKKLAPAAGHLIGSIDNIEKGKELLDNKIDSNGIAKALESLFSELGEEEFLTLIRRFLKNTIVVMPSEGTIQLNTDAGINKVFQGKIFSIYPLIFEVLKVNYPDFFLMAEGFGSQLKTFIGKYTNENTEPILKK